jgi:hypothetical protein
MLEKYPTIQDLSRASYEEFFPYYQWLGYYSRARNLLKTAKIITDEYDGVFPRDKSLLKKLPGVGEYTARAILAFGYTEPILAWDTNLETIFSRYYNWDKQIKLTESEKEEIEEDFRNFVEKYVSWVSVFTCEFWEYVSEDFREKFQTVWATASFWNLENQAGNRFQNETEKIETFGTFSHKSTREIMSEKNNIIRNINNWLMDWARLMEPKNSNLLNRETYIFKESEFYISGWETEIIEKKITQYFPIPDATVIVILHQDHRMYYSLAKDIYSPFILPPSEDRDTRKYVQDYFRDNYQLELSVRPVHKKWITTDGKPYIAVNAQIQAGKVDFNRYTKSEAKNIISDLTSL